MSVASQFGGSSAFQSMSISAGLELGGWWRPEVLCGESLAGDRTRHLVTQQGHNEASAKRKVMGEFRHLFWPGVAWRAEVQCGEHSAGARAAWLQNEKGMNVREAQDQVMSEFEDIFTVKADAPGNPGWQFVWSGDALCGEHSAQNRCNWLQSNKHLSLDQAQRTVIKEFPSKFAWHPEMQCAEHTAFARACFLMNDKQFSFQHAVHRVRAEFPHLFVPAGASPTLAAPMADADESRLVWHDDFPYEGAPDPSKWGYDEGGHGWGNNELQHYTSREANAWVSGGTLKICARCENFEGRKYTSARLITKSKGDWLYGRIEVRAKLPTARGSWPAIWMLPTDWAYGNWPKSGEIDIMEHVGYDCGQVHGTVHTDKYNHMKQTQVGKQIPVDVAEWHVYTVEWSESGIDFGVDGQRYHRFENDGSGSAAWPFNKRFHLLLNVAVGGDWGGQKGIDGASFEGNGQIMEVSSVRVYAKAQ